MFKFKNVKSKLLRFSNLIVLSLIVVLVGFIAIICTYKFNSLGYDYKTYNDTRNVMKSESDYQKVTDKPNSSLDNFTDSLMLLTAYHPLESGDSVIEEAMRNTSTKNGSPRKSFENDISKGSEFDYSRYWHGYLVYLKPLLKFFNYKQIRIINAMAEGALLFTLILILIKKKYVFVIIPFLLAYYFISPLTIASSMQYSAVWYIILLSNIFYLLFQEKIIEHKLHYLYFALVGMLTSYFDLLTYPIASLGFLMIIMISTEKLSFWESIKRIIICGLSWCFGYGFMWVSKIILASLFIKDGNVWEEAKDAFSNRSSNFSSNGVELTDEMFYLKLYKRLTPDIENANEITKVLGTPFIKNSIVFAVVSSFIYLAWVIVKNKCKSIGKLIKNQEKSNIDDLDTFDLIDSKNGRIITNIVLKVIIIAFLSLISTVWFKLARQHSYVHTFMTYRTLSVLAFALYMVPFKLIYDIGRVLSFNNVATDVKKNKKK